MLRHLLQLRDILELEKVKKFIPQIKNYPIQENFFNMMFGKVPNKQIVKAFDVSMILYAEHSFNVSTFTAEQLQAVFQTCMELLQEQ